MKHSTIHSSAQVSAIMFPNDCIIRLTIGVEYIKLNIISANDSAQLKPLIKMMKSDRFVRTKSIITLLLLDLRASFYLIITILG